MRIFYASERSPNAFLKSDLWRNNLYLPLVDLGHEVVEFDYDLRETFQNVDFNIPSQRSFIKKNRPKVTQGLLRQIKAAHAVKPIDLFFSYFYDACILPEAIDDIRAMGIKTVNWYCNGSYQLHLVKEISSHYDWCLVPEKFRIKDYISMGARPIYCQEAANPNIYKPYDLPKEFDVTFVGQAYGERPAYIKLLLNEGIDVRVWGYGWEMFSSRISQRLQEVLHMGKELLKHGGWQFAALRLRKQFQSKKPMLQGFTSSEARIPKNIVGGVLSDIEMIKMYSRSKINLGFSSCGNTYEGERILQVRLRDFEITMSGGFYMVEYMEELEEFFEIDREIVCYREPEEMAEKIKYYLNHDEEREAISKAGYKRCLRDHTWHKRFEMAFHEMGLT